MIADQMLVNAPIVVKDDKENRTPAWVTRADWSENDALLAYWSAHPPAIRGDFLIGRAEAYAANMRAEIAAQRQQQGKLWKVRGDIIAAYAEKVAAVPDSEHAARKREEARAEGAKKLDSLRSDMNASRREVRRCVRYLRAIHPKVVSSYSSGRE